MGSPTPEQAVVDELSRPPGTITDPAQPQRGAPTPTIVTGGLGFVADLECAVQLPATAALLDPARNEIRSETAFR